MMGKPAHTNDTEFSKKEFIYDLVFPWLYAWRPFRRFGDVPDAHGSREQALKRDIFPLFLQKYQKPLPFCTDMWYNTH